MIHDSSVQKCTSTKSGTELPSGAMPRALVAQQAHEEQHAVSNEELRHDIRWVACAEDLCQLDNPTELLLLQPQYANVQMPHAAYSLALMDAECGGGIDVWLDSQLNAKIVCEGHSPDGLTCCIHYGYEFLLGRILGNRTLRLAVRCED